MCEAVEFPHNNAVKKVFFLVCFIQAESARKVYLSVCMQKKKITTHIQAETQTPWNDPSILLTDVTERGKSQAKTGRAERQQCFCAMCDHIHIFPKISHSLCFAIRSSVSDVTVELVLLSVPLCKESLEEVFQIGDD